MPEIIIMIKKLDYLKLDLFHNNLKQNYDYVKRILDHDSL